MEERKKPIGVFDSGVGGLTVLKEIKRLLPNEDLIYFGDTARAPYGPRSKDIIEKYSYDIVKFLLEFDVKYIVVACNTASSLALDFLREEFPDVNIMGVIEPGVITGLSHTKNKKIGVIGTVGTIESGSYTRGLKNLDKDVKVFSKACPLFVPLIEEGWIDHKVTKLVVEEYLKDLKGSGIDTLILGCTHYPVIKDLIQEFIGNDVKIVDSAQTTAKFLKKSLEEKNLLNDKKEKGFIRFYVSNEVEKFKKVGYYLFNEPIENVQMVRW